jgi:hypothetical protein
MSAQAGNPPDVANAGITSLARLRFSRIIREAVDLRSRDLQKIIEAS